MTETPVVGPPVVVGTPSGGIGVVVGEPIIGPALPEDTPQIGPVLAREASLTGAALWTGQGPPPVPLIGAQVGDEYLDELNGNLYRLNPGA